MDELEGMSREDLLQIARDAKGPKAPITFDPNHPPAVQYVFREFPKTMYRADENKVVQNRAEQEALGADWGERPGFMPLAAEAEPAPVAAKGKRK